MPLLSSADMESCSFFLYVETKKMVATYPGGWEEKQLLHFAHVYEVEHIPSGVFGGSPPPRSNICRLTHKFERTVMSRIKGIDGGENKHWSGGIMGSLFHHV